jgi:hypothetical protein
MGKSLVSERVVLAVSMLDQLLRQWVLERDLSAQATTIFENREDTMRVDISHVPLLCLSSIWASFSVLSLQ